MNTSFFPFVAIALPLGCFLSAAWPLLLSRRVRPALLGAGGSTCVGFGATVVGLFASGALPLTTSAQEVANNQPPGSEYAVCAALEAPPAETTNATVEWDPAINTP